MSRPYTPDFISSVANYDSDINVRPALEVQQEAEFFVKIANDTKSCLVQLADTPTYLPADKLIIHEEKIERDSMTSPTNIGLYLASLVAMRDMEMISSDQARFSIDGVLNTLDGLDKYRGLFFNWYDSQTGITRSTIDDRIVSTVDNAWLAVGLMTIRNAGFGNSSEHADRLYQGIDLSVLYDEEAGLFYGHFNASQDVYSAYHNDILLSETRIASYLGLANHSLPLEHFQSLGRFAPAGHSEPDCDTTHAIKSWGGSMFEALMPTLFVDESFSADLSNAHSQQVAEQIVYGDRHLRGHWGVSVCLTPQEGYQELGIRSNAMSDTYKETGIITPHAKLLALPFAREAVIAGMKWDTEHYPTCYSDQLGFCDSIDTLSGKVSGTYLALDQAMAFLALYNDSQESGGLWQYTSHELTRWAADQSRSIGSLAIQHPAAV